MSHIEKRTPFSPVDGKRLLQQHNKRPPKGHRRGKTSGGSTNKTSSKDENSSLASLVDDTGFDFLTNPKPETGAKRPHLESSVWSSTSKTPKISNVTLMKLQTTLLENHNHENVPILLAQPVDAVNKTKEKPNKPRSKQMPPPEGSVNVLSKSTTQQPIVSLQKWTPDPSRKSHVTTSLETIIEGTPEQERESPPTDSPQPKALTKGLEAASSPQDRNRTPNEP
jgi:hypothetical protein